MSIFDDINFLLLLNFIVWIFPPFFQKGLNRIYLLLVAFLFSQSYWTYVVFYNYFSFNLDGNTVEAMIPDVLFYSLIAGFSFSISTALFIKKNQPKFNLKRFRIKSPLKKIPRAHGIMRGIRLFLMFSLVYCYFSAIADIRVGDRIEFMDETRSLWYTTLLPINSILLSMLIVYDIRWSSKKVSFSTKVTLLFILLHVILVGFDGSRRYSIIPIVAMGFSLFSMVIDDQERKAKLEKTITVAMFCFVVVTTVLMLNRSYLVGWQMFYDHNLTFTELSSIILTYLFSPMSTLHVNTQMADFTSIEGAQGYFYYFYAIGNSLFPRFVFQVYFFGDPLVVFLHEKFGWYGQDFGFLAEAIYSGKAKGVITMHLLFGFVVAKVLNNVHLKKVFYISLALGIIFGMVYSLRSDFMNLLKATLYPSLCIYFALRFMTKSNEIK